MTEQDKRESLSFLGGLASNICTVILTVIAVWALFFSNKHEKLLEMYQSDIRLAKTELTVLKQQAGDLENQKRELQNQLTEINGKVRKLNLDKVRLELGMAQKQKLISKTKNELLNAQNLELHKLTLSFSRRIDRIIKEHETKARLLTLRPKFIAWLSTEPLLPKYVGPSILEKGYKEKSAEHREKLKAARSLHHDWILSNPLLGNLPRRDSLDMIERVNIDTEWHKTTILKYNSKVRTVSLKRVVYELLEKLVQENSLQVTTKSLENFRGFVLSYISKNVSANSIYLDYSLTEPVTEQEIVSTGKSSLESIKEARLYISNLNDYLVGSLDDIEE
jgi:hypothetical protein